MAGKKEIIKNAFIEMIAQMPIESIRTEELLKRAGVSKATFYRLFRDKYDVMNSVYMDVSAPMVQEKPDLSHWREWTIRDMENVRKHRTFFRNILSYQGQNSLRETVRAFYHENILRQVAKAHPRRKIPPKLSYLVDAFAEVSAFTLLWWIKSDFQPEPEILVDYIDTLIPEALRPYYTEADPNLPR